MKTIKAGCKGCLHCRKLMGEYICYYSMDTGRLKDCTADNCDKYQKKKRKGSAKGAQRERLYMAKSIIQQAKSCFITGATRGLHQHHIYFGNPWRELSERYGLWVYLRYDWHEYQPYAVHVDHRLNQWFKRLGQRAFEQTHTRTEFMQIFGCNYLGDEPQGATDYDDPCPAELYRPPLPIVDCGAFLEEEPEVLPY